MGEEGQCITVKNRGAVYVAYDQTGSGREVHKKKNMHCGLGSNGLEGGIAGLGSIGV